MKLALMKMRPQGEKDFSLNLNEAVIQNEFENFSLSYFKVTE